MLVTFARRVLEGVGCLYRRRRRGLRTGRFAGASLDVVLKHPSSWCRDPRGFIFWSLGVGFDVGYGVGCAAGSPPGVKPTTRPHYRDFDGPFGSPDRARHDGIVGLGIGAM